MPPNMDTCAETGTSFFGIKCCNTTGYSLRNTEDDDDNAGDGTGGDVGDGDVDVGDDDGEYDCGDYDNEGGDAGLC